MISVNFKLLKKGKVSDNCYIQQKSELKSNFWTKTFLRKIYYYITDLKFRQNVDWHSSSSIQLEILSKALIVETFEKFFSRQWTCLQFFNDVLQSDTKIWSACCGLERPEPRPIWFFFAETAARKHTNFSSKDFVESSKKHLTKVWLCSENV